MFKMNPVMIHNGELVKCKGFSSEVIIGQTLSWIKSAKDKQASEEIRDSVSDFESITLDCQPIFPHPEEKSPKHVDQTTNNDIGWV